VREGGKGEKEGEQRNAILECQQANKLSEAGMILPPSLPPSRPPSLPLSLPCPRRCRGHHHGENEATSKNEEAGSDLGKKRRKTTEAEEGG
jgi:hypothetical protein